MTFLSPTKCPPPGVQDTVCPHASQPLQQCLHIGLLHNHWARGKFKVVNATFFLRLKYNRCNKAILEQRHNNSNKQKQKKEKELG
jgi:hypothetical protein